MKPGSSAPNVIQLGRAREERAGQAQPRQNPSGTGLHRRSRSRRIIAVGGGKGGIGKSLVSTNVGVALAKRGHRVVMVDADLGGANLHTCLGVTQPQRSLSDFVTRRVERIEDVVVPTGIPNLGLIAGAQDLFDAANPKFQQKVALIRSLQAMDVDYLLLDLGAGTGFTTLDFFLIADHGLLVLLPEPTSVENAYRFVKAAFFRKMQYLGDRLGIAEVMAELFASQDAALRSPYEFVAQVRKRKPQAGEALERELRAFRVKLVVNQVRTAADQSVGKAVVSAWKKFSGLEMDFLGSIPYDDEAWKAVRKRRPLLLERPESQAAQGLVRVAEALSSYEAPAEPR